MNSWAIIGHGKSPEGKGWGTRIDAYNRVVRQWNWHWQNEEDWGKRFDYGFYELQPTEMARFFRHVCRKPMVGWIGTRNRHHKPYDGGVPLPTLETVDLRAWEALGMALGGVGTKGRLGLTRGTQAALWAITTASRGDQVALVGYDNVYAGLVLEKEDGFPQSYIDCPAGFPFRDYKGGGTKYGNHDFAVEGPLLRSVANKAGVVLTFSQEWDDEGRSSKPGAPEVRVRVGT